MKSLKSLVSLFLILGLAISAFPAYRAHAQISPATTSSSTLCIQSNGVCPANVAANVGQTFTTDIVLTNANANCLQSYQMNLDYNASVIWAVGFTEGNWADGNAPFNFVNTIDNSLGTLTYGSALLGANINFTSATLFTVTWQMHGLGTSSITNSTVPLLSSLCPNGGPFATLLPPPPVTSGSAHNNPLTVCVQSSGICPANVKVAVGQNFNVDIVLSNVNLLQAYQVEVDWNASVLNAISITEGNWAGTNPVFNFVNTIDNSLGTLTYGSGVLGTTVNVTRATLFTITFTLLQAGSSMITAPVITVSSTVEAPLISGVGIGQPFVILLPTNGTPSITNGAASFIAATAILTKVVPAHFIIFNGNSQTLTASITNTGTVTAYVQVHYTILSLFRGTISLQTTSILAMPAGTKNTLSVTYTVPTPLHHIDIYLVTGKLFVSADGVNFTDSHSSKTTFYIVFHS